MNAIRNALADAWCFMHRMAPWALAVYFWMLTSPVAWAAKKKAAEAIKTKSYTIPYMIVIALVSLGLMTILRPGTRLDKPADQKDKAEGA